MDPNGTPFINRNTDMIFEHRISGSSGGVASCWGVNTVRFHRIVGAGQSVLTAIRIDDLALKLAVAQ
jgi:hypothetical protein